MQLRKNQGGFTLAEMAVAAAILSLVLATGLIQKRSDLRGDLGRAQGQHLAIARDAVNAYMAINRDAIIAGSVTGYADPLAPTTQELLTAGFLPAGFGLNLYGSGYQNEIWITPAGCVADACHLDSLTWTTGPIIDAATGLVDGIAIGEALVEIGADGGASLVDPLTISGRAGGWAENNPVGAPAGTLGILAARGGFGSYSGGGNVDLTRYLARDGSRTMSAALDVNDNDILSTASLSASAVSISGGASLQSVSSGAVSVGGNLDVPNGGSNQISLTGNVSGSSMDITAQSGVALAAGAINVNGNVQVFDVTEAGGVSLAMQPKISIVNNASAWNALPACPAGLNRKVYMIPSAIGYDETSAAQLDGVQYSVQIDNPSSPTAWRPDVKVFINGGTTSVTPVDQNYTRSAALVSCR